MLEGAKRVVFEVKLKGWQVNPNCIKYIQTDYEIEIYRWLESHNLSNHVSSIKKLGNFSIHFQPEDGVDVQLFVNSQPQVILCSDFGSWKKESEEALEKLWSGRYRDLVLCLMPFFIGTALWFCFFY